MPLDTVVIFVQLDWYPFYFRCIPWVTCGHLCTAWSLPFLLRYIWLELLGSHLDSLIATMCTWRGGYTWYMTWDTVVISVQLDCYHVYLEGGIWLEILWSSLDSLIATMCIWRGGIWLEILWSSLDNLIATMCTWREGGIWREILWSSLDSLIDSYHVYLEGGGVYDLRYCGHLWTAWLLPCVLGIYSLRHCGHLCTVCLISSLL